MPLVAADALIALKTDESFLELSYLSICFCFSMYIRYSLSVLCFYRRRELDYIMLLLVLQAIVESLLLSFRWLVCCICLPSCVTLMGFDRFWGSRRELLPLR